MPEPYCLAMVLCDHVHRDPATGKSTILGTFATLGASTFPAPCRMAVYWAVTDAVGEFTLSFRLVDAKDILDDSVEPVFSLSFPMNSPDPLAVLEGHLNVEGTLPTSGVYHCEMFADSELLMSRRLVAIEMPSKQEPNDE